MALNRYFNTSFWKDNYIVDLDPTEKLLFNYLFTNAKANIAGVYEIHVREIAFDTGIDKDMVPKLIGRFSNDGKLFYVNGWIILVNALKHQKLNPNIVIGIRTQYEALPDDIKGRVLDIWLKKKYEDKLDWLSSESKDARVEVKISEAKKAEIEYQEKQPDDRKTAYNWEAILIDLNVKLGGSKTIKTTQGRKDKLKKRMKTFTLEEIEHAATVIGADDFLQGNNDRKTKYATIDFLIRSDEQVAKYLEREAPTEKKKTKRGYF